MAKVLVSGGSGFLGSHLADALSEAGHQVTILDLEPSPYLRPEQDMVVGDVRDQDLVRRCMAGQNYVYHLAALADLNQALDRPLETVRVNIEGTLNVLEAARGHRIKRLLFASTIYVHSREGGFYRCSKQACEAYIEEYQRRFGLDYTVLRFGSLYGPRSDESNGFYRLLLSAAREGRVSYHGEPENLREFIHVQDAAKLSVAALEPAYANQHLVLTGHQPMRFKDLFAMFSEILGRPVEADFLPPDQGRGAGHYRVTPYAFSAQTGHKLTSAHYVDLGQGVLQLLEEMYQHGQFPNSQPSIHQAPSQAAYAG